jgi:hypothetical protein
MDSNKIGQSEQECHDMTTKELICDNIIKYKEMFNQLLRKTGGVFDVIKSAVKWIRYM